MPIAFIGFVVYVIAQSSSRVEPRVQWAQNSKADQTHFVMNETEYLLACIAFCKLCVKLYISCFLQMSLDLKVPTNWDLRIPGSL